MPPKRTPIVSSKTPVVIDDRPAPPPSAPEPVTAGVRPPAPVAGAVASSEAFSQAHEFCPTCGTVKTTEVCPVDGTRFAGEA